MTTHDLGINPPLPSSRWGGSIVPVSGPSGLPDSAVSPLGLPIALMSGEIRVAFLGRTSTEDQQDPRQSLLRQLGGTKTALPESWVIVAHFYDVESGRLELDARGRGTGYQRFDIPIARDGGITDLLDEAAQPDRRFDVVICESVSRVARRAFEGLSIERALERADVALFAANEPITATGSRAQRILQRRINQSIAEYEVLNTLEQSWGGLCTHVREGWNLGKPPYGYHGKTYRHPNPTKAEKGIIKTRLEPDGARGETVTQMALWRYHEGIGYDTIAERLNQDLEKFPPPIPPGKHRARGAWSKTSVYEILRNPKYTGYQVFNRRASRSRHGKVNDPAKWVWSTEPAHEPLIPKWMYDELNARRQAKRGSRSDNNPNSHRETRHTYVFRSMVFCSCGRRMCGNPRHDTAYYMCAPRNNNRGRPDKYAGHEKSLYIREDAIMDAVSRFFAYRVFGKDRRAILEAELSTLDDRVEREQEAERGRLQRALADVARRQNTVMRQAQEGDPDDPFTRALRTTYNELDAERAATLAAIAALDVAADAEPDRPTAADVALLDAMPHLAANLAQAPEPLLRRLFEDTRLSVRLDDDGDHVLISIALPGDNVPTIVTTVEQMGDAIGEMPGQAADSACDDAVRAPGATRTHTGRILSRLPSVA
ncbi:MAG TPA: recombinase family protein [Pseudonocardiaceae bacterium]|nr:recombinase family protein [Pseudonocardiaceae bacterium]